MKLIPVSKSYAKVDESDFDELSRYVWCEHKKPNTSYAFRYVRNNGPGPKYKRIKMHNQLMSPSSGLEVDHIDNDGLNNQRDNLRCVTHADNSRNQKVSSARKHSIYKGVSRASQNSWLARARLNGVLVRIGTFKTEVEAASAYNVFVQEYFESFVSLNVILQ